MDGFRGLEKSSEMKLWMTPMSQAAPVSKMRLLPKLCFQDPLL